MYSSQTSNSSELSDAIFALLTSQRFTDKRSAVDLLDHHSNEIDYARLRWRILQAVKTDYSVRTEEIREDQSIGDVRAWLLNVLGTIANGDKDIVAEIVKHINSEIEPHLWARYLAFEGLITGKNNLVDKVAREASQRKGDPLMSCLGLALMASKGDPSAQNRIRANLTNPKLDWYVVRALRIVPLQFTVPGLCNLVEKAESSYKTYDAIVALGRLRSDSRAEPAVQALSSFIGKARGNPWLDGMRAAAITALGNLKIESSGPLLLEELTDYNPAIVREAARSATKVLGIQTVIQRVVEAAIKSVTPFTVDALARALRWVDRDAAVEELVNLMGSGSIAQQDMARVLLSELGGTAAFEKLHALTAATKQYREILEHAEDRIQDLFEQTGHEAQKGFQFASWMDLAVFGLGILLLAASAFAALYQKGDLAIWAGVGGAGVLGVIYSLLISNPRRQVREAVDHLMQVKIIFLAYLRRLHQTDQAYTRLLLGAEKVTAEQLRDYSGLVGKIMEDTAKQLAGAVPVSTAGPGKKPKRHAPGGG
jgi:hypothetical protein